MEYVEKEFKDRILVNPNRRKIIIRKQSADEIIADIEPITEEIVEAGTVFNAALMNDFQKSIVRSEKASAEAAELARAADENAKAACENVVEKQGTKVMKNGVFVSEFNADEKVDNQDLEALKQRVSVLETGAVVTKISYDASTNTFVV